MSDLTKDLVIPFFFFLLGLLAEKIKPVLQKEKRRVRYSLLQRPVIAIDEGLPQSVLAKLPGAPAGNVSEFRLDATNTGNLPIVDANLLLEPSKGAQLLECQVRTNPPREVPYGAVEHPNEHEVRCPGIVLERNQSITVSAFYLSTEPMHLKVYWSGGGGAVHYEAGEGRFREGAAVHVAGIIRNYILSEVVTVFVSTLGFVVTTFIPAIEPSRATMAGVGIGQLIATSLRLYFLLRIVPHAVALVEMYRFRGRFAG